MTVIEMLAIQMLLIKSCMSLNLPVYLVLTISALEHLSQSYSLDLGLRIMQYNWDGVSQSFNREHSSQEGIPCKRPLHPRIQSP
jgi:hypothetical protein